MKSSPPSARPEWVIVAGDSRLGREVAIKVSAERFSERFERETRAIALLNHPNLCTLHDVGAKYLADAAGHGAVRRSAPHRPADGRCALSRP